MKKNKKINQMVNKYLEKKEKQLRKLRLKKIELESEIEQVEFDIYGVKEGNK